ncbi:MAG: large-conductance mechanosensitive channel protein MscL [Bdellovibrionales bacterium]
MEILKEFRDFAVKGNVLDMAVGIIIGAEFGKIVTSLVADVIMPPIGLLVGGVDFKNLVIPLKRAEDGKALVSINIGHFLNTVITFMIIAFAVFLLVKAFNRLRPFTTLENPKPPQQPPKT